MPADSLTIVSVSTGRHWRDFHRVKREVYRHDPNAPRPLGQMERLPLDTRKHPFYQHARREAFVAYRNGKPVGRIASILDDLHQEHYGDKVGTFGFFECIDDTSVSAALLKTAEDWLLERGCDTVRGPVNPSLKAEFGVLVEGHEHLPLVMMGHTPLYYEGLLQAAGYDSVREFYSYRYFRNIDPMPTANWANVSRLVKACAKRFPDLQFRDVNKSDFEATLRDINRLGNEVRSDNFGFVPLTDAELDFMIQQLRRVIRLDLIIAAYRGDQLVGFIVTVPDINWALKRSRGPWDWIRIPQFLYWVRRTPRCRVIALGVDEESRKKGIAVTLIDRLIQKYEEFDCWDFSWVVEDNVNSMRVINRTMSLVKYKTYRLYEKALSAAGLPKPE